MLTDEEIEKKKPLWAVLASLWLDDYEFELNKNKTNEEMLKTLVKFYPVSEHNKIKKIFENINSLKIKEKPYDYIARMMISSKYALDEIRLIFENEISPIFCLNVANKTVFARGKISNELLFQAIFENIEKQLSDITLGESIRDESKKFIKDNIQIENYWNIIVALYEKKKIELEKLNLWIASNLILDKENLEIRKQLWEAFSDFWLDNQLQDFHFKYTLSLMNSSGYSLKKIESIFFQEVAPAVYFNLYALPGGVWLAFDEDWLFPQIVKNIEKQETNSLYRYWVKSSLGKFVMTKMVQDDWNKIVELYKVYDLEINNKL